MKVVHLVPALFGPDGIVGGAERYALELARQMAARVETRLVTFGERNHREKVGPLDVQVIGRPWHVRGQRTNPFHLRLFTSIGDADVVHCHQQHVLMSSAAALWCRARRRRVFVSDLGGGGWDISAYVTTDRWFHGHLHLSEYSRRVFGHEHAANAHVVGGGVDVERFRPEPSVPRNGAVLFVGRVLPHKGLDDLIRALPEGMPLRIVGPQPDRGTAVALGQLAAGRSVTFTGHVDDVQLVREYQSARCVVLPSVYRTSGGTETRVPELLGLALIEGMACEAPAIGTSVANLPEVIAHGVTGFVVPPNDPAALGDRLQVLRDHPQYARALGQAARRRVLERFTWDRVLERCLAAYETRP